jgi:hypothetical protein
LIDPNFSFYGLRRNGRLNLHLSQPLVMNADMMLPTPTPAELEPCYHVAPQGANEGVRGCPHYSRNCKKCAAAVASPFQRPGLGIPQDFLLSRFAECCRKFVACRLCHDDEPMSLKVAHKLDR